MVPSFLFDISKIDLDAVQFTAEDIEAVNPHRGAMRQLDAVAWASDDYLQGAAWRDVRDDEFWVPGHIPGRPVLPGVMMVEAAAQLASFMTTKIWPDIGFLGFSGIDDVKFRGQVVPGQRLYIIGRAINFRPRRFICAAQGIVAGKMVFEAKVTGMPI